MENLESTNTPEFQLSDDSATLVKYTGDADTFAIPEGVTTIGYKAFDYAEKLRHVAFPDSLRVIEDFAFLNCGIESFEAPAHLEKIGERAFLRCSHLASITLNQGLKEIGSEAFYYTAIEQLTLPNSITNLGGNIINYTPLFQNHDLHSFTIEPGGTYHIDATGAIYQAESSDEQTLIDASFVDVASYTVEPHTTAIAPSAFISNKTIECIVLPEGLRDLGDHAFQSCTALSEINFPESLETIGAKAFYETRIRSAYLPQGFKHLEDDSLSDTRISALREPNYLTHIEVHPDNARYFMHENILCERTEDGEERAILYAGTDKTVTLPPSITRMSHRLLIGSSGIETLHIHNAWTEYDSTALVATMPITTVVVHIVKQWEETNTIPVMDSKNFLREELHLITLTDRECVPLSQRDSITLHFPFDARASRDFSNAMKDVMRSPKKGMMYADRVMFNFEDTFRRAKYALDRLKDPLYMVNEVDETFTKMLRGQVIVCSIAFAENQYWQGFDDMIDLGFITADNIEKIIDAISDTKDVEATSMILDVQKRRFSSLNEGETVSEKYAL